ncbi:MAG TPA: hypothetical protein VFX25_11745 [Streptosporangiaceae bacterium]|nr:hypothetical protein [Streptosporangiaceae bacterium]
MTLRDNGARLVTGLKAYEYDHRKLVGPNTDDAASPSSPTRPFDQLSRRTWLTASK